MERRPADELIDATESAVLVDEAALNEKRQVETEAGVAFHTGGARVSGTFADIPIAGVLGRLWRERASGALLARRDQVKKIIYLRQGNATNVRSNLVSECLGQLLVKERIISAAQCEASIASMKKSREPQGEILTKMGAITAGNLQFALELQLENKLFEPFSWTTGEYRFDAGAEPVESNVRIEWQGAAVIVEGIRRSFDEKRLLVCMDPVMDARMRWRGVVPSFPTLGFTPPESAAALKLILPASPRAMIGRMRCAKIVALRVIYGLIALEQMLPA